MRETRRVSATSALICTTTSDITPPKPTAPVRNTTQGLIRVHDSKTVVLALSQFSQALRQLTLGQAPDAAPQQIDNWKFSKSRGFAYPATGNLVGDAVGRSTFVSGLVKHIP